MKMSSLAVAGIIAATALLTLGLPAAAQPAPGDAKAYLISMLTPTDEAAFARYTSATADLLARHGGAYAVAPIRVEKELPNDYLPDVYVPFPSAYVLIASFDDAGSLSAFTSAAMDHFDAWSGQFTTAIRFAAAVAPAPNDVGPLPVIGEVDPRPAPAFILLNASSFKPLPESPEYLAKYGSAAHVVVDVGTRFLATFAKVGDVTGSYPHDILFLSEWADEKAFESVHGSAEWRAVVPYRNFALSSFTEAKGVIQTQP